MWAGLVGHGVMHGSYEEHCKSVIASLLSPLRHVRVEMCRHRLETEYWYMHPELGVDDRYLGT